jgi:hypothetical protein
LVNARKFYKEERIAQVIDNEGSLLLLAPLANRLAALRLVGWAESDICGDLHSMSSCIHTKRNHLLQHDKRRRIINSLHYDHEFLGNPKQTPFWT